MDICQADALQVKAPNEQNITCIMYLEMEKVTNNLNKS